MLSIFLALIVFVNCISTKEFCNSEIFEPSCLRNDVLFIKKATFGREIIGKCIKSEGGFDEYLSKKPGYTNCYTDVRHIIEPQCAGKQSCKVQVVGIEADSKCSNVFKDHLDVDHTCLKGWKKNPS